MARRHCGRAVDAGLKRIEVASFVKSGKVPQMADAEAMLEALPPPRDLVCVGLALNHTGFERAAHSRAGAARVFR